MTRINTLPLTIVIALMISLSGCAAMLAGTVSDRDTQKPLDGVKVKVKDKQGRLLHETITRKQGHFEIDNLDKKSEVTLTFDADNIISCAEVYNLQKLSEDEATHLKIKLEAFAVIKGIVKYNKNNNPIAGARVKPRLEDEQGNLSDAPAEAVTTNNDGSFFIKYLSPGKYRLFIECAKYKPVCYPSEGPHELQRGTTWQNITISLELIDPLPIPPPKKTGTEKKSNGPSPDLDEVLKK
jgi:hypothetical protein